MFFFKEQKIYTNYELSCTHLQNAVNFLFLRIAYSDFQKFFVCIQFVDFRGVLQNRICFSVYHSGQCHGMIDIVSVVDDKRNTLSIAVRYQNACQTSKYAAITHRSLRCRFFGFLCLGATLRFFISSACPLCCRFAEECGLGV